MLLEQGLSTSWKSAILSLNRNPSFSWISLIWMESSYIFQDQVFKFVVFSTPQWGGKATASCLFPTPLLSHVFLPFAPCWLWHQNNHLHVLKRQVRELIQFETSFYESSSLFPTGFHHSAIPVCTVWVHRAEGKEEDRQNCIYLQHYCFMPFKYFFKYGLGRWTRSHFLAELFFFFYGEERFYQLMPLVPPGLGKRINVDQDREA